MTRGDEVIDRDPATWACAPRRPDGPTFLAVCNRCNRWHQLHAFTDAGRCRWPDVRSPRPVETPPPLNAQLLMPVATRAGEPLLMGAPR